VKCSRVVWADRAGWAQQPAMPVIGFLTSRGSRSDGCADKVSDKMTDGGSLTVGVSQSGDKYIWQLYREGIIQKVKYSGPIYFSAQSAMTAGKKARAFYLARLEPRTDDAAKMSSRELKIGQSVFYRPTNRMEAAGPYAVIRLLLQPGGEVCYRIRSLEDDSLEYTADERELRPVPRPPVRR
jgi:hypothetical protein